MSALSSLVIIGNSSQSSACRVLQEKALNQLLLLKKSPILKEHKACALYHNYPKLQSCPKYDQGSLDFSKDLLVVGRAAGIFLSMTFHQWYSLPKSLYLLLSGLGRLHGLWVLRLAELAMVGTRRLFWRYVFIPRCSQLQDFNWDSQ